MTVRSRAGVAALVRREFADGSRAGGSGRDAAPHRAPPGAAATAPPFL
ncbi:hypothetical protein [Streptomyces sundarbansensis]